MWFVLLVSGRKLLRRNWTNWKPILRNWLLEELFMWHQTTSSYLALSLSLSLSLSSLYPPPIPPRMHTPTNCFTFKFDLPITNDQN